MTTNTIHAFAGQTSFPIAGGSTVNSVSVNGSAATFSQTSEAAVLATPAAQGDTVSVTFSERPVFGLVLPIKPAAGWSVDTTGSIIALSPGGSVDLVQGSGEITLTEGTYGATAKFLLGGGSVALIGQAGGTFVATGAPPSGKIGVYWTGSVYRIVSNMTSGVFINFAGVRTSPYSY